jgi:hypothetical protein
MGEFYAARERLDLISRKYPQAVSALGYQEEIDKMLAASQNRLNEGGKKPSVWTRIGF